MMVMVVEEACCLLITAKIRNWLRPQPMLIPWIPYGIPDGFHGFQVDSIWNNPGKVKTSFVGPETHPCTAVERAWWHSSPVAEP
jgi:hypothetical protein